MDRNLVAAPINNLNQIKRRVVGGATWNYPYDLDGNMTGKTDVQGPGGLDVRYTYDSIGRILTRSSAGLLTQFVWDGWDCVREVTGTDDTVYHIPNGILQSFSLNGRVVVASCGDESRVPHGTFLQIFTRLGPVEHTPNLLGRGLAALDPPHPWPGD